MVIHSSNDPRSCASPSLSIKVWPQIGSTLCLHTLSKTSKMWSKHFSLSTPLIGRPRRITITFSPSGWGKVVASYPTLATSKANSIRSQTAVRTSLHSHSSAGCKSLTPYTNISGSTMLLGWAKFYPEFSPTSSWRRQLRLHSTTPRRRQRKVEVFARSFHPSLRLELGATCLQETSAPDPLTKSTPSLQDDKAIHSA